MEVEGGSALHPLMVTSKPHKLEDSMDMSVDAEKRVGEEEEAQRVFGMPTVGTQGPAGSRVPDLDEPMRRRRQHPQFEEEDEDERPWGEGVDPSDPDAPLDAVGPHPAVDAEMTAEDFAFDPGADAAAAAVVAARHAGCSGSAALMDALEAAEDAFEQQQDTKVAAVQRQKQARLESPRKAGTSGTAGSAAAWAAAETAPVPGVSGAAEWAAGAGQPPDTPRKAAISEGTREKMIQAVYEALQANPRCAGCALALSLCCGLVCEACWADGLAALWKAQLASSAVGAWGSADGGAGRGAEQSSFPRYSSEPSRSVMHHAQSVEDALFTSSHSKQVYLSKVSNAVRLARTVPNVGDIPRIASGEPREVAEGHTAGEATPYVTDLTGYVVKPQM